MTVTEVIANFRAGLLGLLPSVERLGIPWRRASAYDTWDNLVAAVYLSLVVEPLRCCLSESEQTRFCLAEYDMVLPSYVGRSVIEVLPALSNDAVRVFHALGTKETPFDVVEWRLVLPNGVPVTDALESTPLDSVLFAIRMSVDGPSVTGMDYVTDAHAKS